MKHLRYVIAFVVVAAVLARSAAFLLERSLDRKLPQLLTEALGLPVTLAPIQADILSLTARTARLQMGGATHPALVAEEVMVSFDWSDLLRGEIRLVDGAAGNLLLDIQHWPGNDDSPPEDYRNLDRWLPQTLDVARSTYILAGGGELQVEDARWQRLGSGAARLAGRLQRSAGQLQFGIEAASLEDVLALRRLDSRVTLAAGDADVPVAALDLELAPAEAGGYLVDIGGRFAGVELSASAAAAESWHWPQRSEIRMDALNPAHVAGVITQLLTGEEGDGLAGGLTSPLPSLSLPRHRASIRVGELQVGFGVLNDVDVEIDTIGQRVAFNRISADGLYARLRGSGAIASDEFGWDVGLGAEISPRKSERALVARSLGSKWHAHSGEIRLSGRGDTVVGLLNGLGGNVDLAGIHSGVQETPLSLHARLDNSPELFALEDLELRAADSVVSGRLELSGNGPRKLSLELDAGQLDPGFLFAAADSANVPTGVAVPQHLAFLPDFDITAVVRVDGLVLPWLQLSDLSLDFNRTAGTSRGSLAFNGTHGGRTEVQLNGGRRESGELQATLDMTLAHVDVLGLLRHEDGLLDSRISGSMHFAGSSRDFAGLVASLRGRAMLEAHLRSRGDWSRASAADEVVAFGGIASPVVSDGHIVGLDIEDLDIDAIEQDLEGKLSLVSTRDPVLVADLVSRRLSLDQLRAWLPEKGEGGGQLADLRDLGPGRVTLKVEQLDWLAHRIDNLRLSLLSGKRRFTVEQLDFGYRGATYRSALGLTWQGETATLESSGRVDGLRISSLQDTFAVPVMTALSNPLDGSFELGGSGDSLAELLAHLVGSIRLDDTGAGAPGLGAPGLGAPGVGAPGAGASGEVGIDIDFERLPDADFLRVNSLRVDGSELSGTLRRSDGLPDKFDVTLAGGFVDTRPWAAWPAPGQQQDINDADEDSVVRRVMQSVQGVTGFLRRVLRATEYVAPGERIFREVALDASALSELDVRVQGRLDQFYSNAVEAEDLEIDLRAGAGKLSLAVRSPSVNGGSAEFDITLDGTASPYRMGLDLRAGNYHLDSEQGRFPITAHVLLKSRGGTEAELAANLDGSLYLELGRGPMRAAGLGLMSADVGTSVLRRLIPGIDRRAPELRCGITLLQFSDGRGITPFGYAMRTDTANLLGGVELNLRDERVRIRFQSRSRQGMGLSIGNAFSNSVELSGSLGNPQIVPNRQGLLIRGWAAFATGGLSVLGETFFNRVLASQNPCDSVRREIRGDTCRPGQLLAESPVACPAGT